MKLDQYLKEKREIAEKAEQEKWTLGGASGRMITTPSGYKGDGFLADFDTKANATHAATFSPSEALKLLRVVEVMNIALTSIANGSFNARAEVALAEAERILGGGE